MFWVEQAEVISLDGAHGFAARYSTMRAAAWTPLWDVRLIAFSVSSGVRTTGMNWWGWCCSVWERLIFNCSCHRQQQRNITNRQHSLTIWITTMHCMNTTTALLTCVFLIILVTIVVIFVSSLVGWWINLNSMKPGVGSTGLLMLAWRLYLNTVSQLIVSQYKCGL